MTPALKPFGQSRIVFFRGYDTIGIIWIGQHIEKLANVFVGARQAAWRDTQQQTPALTSCYVLSSCF